MKKIIIIKSQKHTGVSSTFLRLPVESQCRLLLAGPACLHSRFMTSWLAVCLFPGLDSNTGGSGDWRQGRFRSEAGSNDASFCSRLSSSFLKPPGSGIAINNPLELFTVMDKTPPQLTACHTKPTHSAEAQWDWRLSVKYSHSFEHSCSFIYGDEGLKVGDLRGID